MQLVEQYTRLIAGLSNKELGVAQEIALAEVAAILFCTQRNATWTLKKMQNQGWLQWQPGRGRGNRSMLTCHLAPQDLVMSAAKELVQKGEIHTSRQLIQQYQSEWAGLEEAYSLWMSSQFGLRVSREKERGQGGRIDTLRFFVDRPFRCLDPIRVLLRSQTHVVKHVFDTLVRFDPVTRTVIGALAFYWESDDSGVEWTFCLRKGVLFHHGRLLTADDVCYSLERSSGAESRHRWTTASIQSVKALDEYTVKVILRQPDRLFLHALSKEYASIVPQDYALKMGAGFESWPIGTGPFKVVRNDDSMLVLEAFQPYFAGRPFLDRVELWCVPEMEAGSDEDHMHLLRSVAGAGIAPTSKGGEWRGFSRHEQSFQYVSLNANKPGPLRRRSFRAVLAAILSGAVLRAELKGARQPVEAWGDALSDLQEETRQPDAVLDEPGAYRHTGEPLRLYTYPDPDHVEDACWIQNRCAQYGIAIEIVYVEPEELARSERLQEADLIVDSANVDERLELSLLEFLYADALSIRHHLDEEGREEVGQQASRMRALTSDTQRPDPMRAILGILLGRHTFVPLYSNRIEMRAHPQLSGICLDAYGWVDFSRVFVQP